MDDSANLREQAFAFYVGIFKESYFGLGTGFTNKFVIGPHNEWVKLAVDNGIFAAALFTLMLGYVVWRAISAEPDAALFGFHIGLCVAAIPHNRQPCDSGGSRNRIGMTAKIHRRLGVEWTSTDAMVTAKRPGQIVSDVAPRRLQSRSCELALQEARIVTKILASAQSKSRASSASASPAATATGESQRY
jgi:hypothetical protein